MATGSAIASAAFRLESATTTSTTRASNRCENGNSATQRNVRLLLNGRHGKAWLFQYFLFTKLDLTMNSQMFFLSSFSNLRLSYDLNVKVGNTDLKFSFKIEGLLRHTFFLFSFFCIIKVECLL